MDNLGDWLYIVLLVIAGVSSFLGSGKKKKRPAAPPVASDDDWMEEEPSRPSGSLWELFEERPPQPQEPTVPPVVSRNKKKKKAPPSLAATSPFLTGEGKYSDRISARPSAPLQSVEEEPGVMPDHVFSDRTELRRAIICAEILNRKYE